MKKLFFFTTILFFIAINLPAKISLANNPSDSANSVSKFGHYLSIGIGSGAGASLNLVGYNLGYSFTYKSHMVSFLYSYGTSSFSGSLEDEKSYTGNCYAILIGEALRRENFMASLSIGFGSSETFFRDVNNGRGYVKYDQTDSTVPIELKVFYHAYNFIGVGIDAVRNIGPEYSSTMISLSILMGIWNKTYQ
jgi:hypothetical protein